MDLIGPNPTLMARAETLDGLKQGGEPQEAVMESASITQVHLQAATEVALSNTVGFADPQLRATIFVENGTREPMLTSKARRV